VVRGWEVRLGLGGSPLIAELAGFFRMLWMDVAVRRRRWDRLEASVDGYLGRLKD